MRDRSRIIFKQLKNNRIAQFFVRNKAKFKLAPIVNKLISFHWFF